MGETRATTIKGRAEELLSCQMTGDAPTRDLSRWVSELPPSMHNRFVKVDLLRAKEKATLAAFIDAYIASRSDVKGSTRTVYERVRRYLVDYFGKDRLIHSILSGDADQWRLNLIERGLAQNTVRRSCGVAKQYFIAAKRRGLVEENPFRDLVSVVKGNAARAYFVSREESEKVLAACPDSEWRVLFALCRFAGLRNPSETLRLRWADIDWEQGRMVVRSPKTEHYEGHDQRVVPIFPDLRPYLMEAFEEAEEGSEFVISRYRESSVNLRTRLQRIINRAGLKPWPKLWHNLRATCQTELADRFPAHVVSAWIGNSTAVAAEHYLQVTDAHYAAAIGSGVPAGEGALHKALQHPKESGRTGCQQERDTTQYDAVRGDSFATSGPGRTRTSDLTLIRGAL